MLEGFKSKIKDILTRFLPKIKESQTNFFTYTNIFLFFRYINAMLD